MKTELLAFAAVFLPFAGAVIGVFATRSTANRTAVAQDRQAAANERATLLEPYSKSLTDLRQEMEARDRDAERERERSRQQSAEDRERITVLEQGQLELAERLERTDYRYREAIGYIRRFRAWVSERMPGVHDAPTIPPALEADLEEGN